MKKVLSKLIIGSLIVSSSLVSFASDTEKISFNGNDDFLNKLEIESVYQPEVMMKASEIIKLYPEINVDFAEAGESFSNAIDYIKEEVKGTALTFDVDDQDFQQYVKQYFLVELDDKKLENELRDFATFMDYYENGSINDSIILEKNSRSDSGFMIQLPVSTNETIEGESTKIEFNMMTRSSYSGSVAADYARTWWNKTNNTSYPYYANRFNLDATRNDYNSLREGESGQSSPRRSWNDCTNFVSQAIAAGGVNEINNGGWSPHKKDENWYYKDSKPSYTWGGAHNFYKHFSSRAGVASSSGDLQVGDVVSIDFTGDGSVDHTIIITKTTGTNSNQQYVTYHTFDTCETKTLGNLYTSYPSGKFYGYELDKL